MFANSVRRLRAFENLCHRAGRVETDRIDGASGDDDGPRAIFPPHQHMAAIEDADMNLVLLHRLDQRFSRFEWPQGDEKAVFGRPSLIGDHESLG